MTARVGQQDSHGRASPLPSTLGTAVLIPSTWPHRVYAGLTIAALAGTVGFGILWPAPVGRQHPFLYALATLSIAYYLAVWFARWLSLRSKRRPTPAKSVPGLQ